MRTFLVRLEVCLIVFIVRSCEGNFVSTLSSLVELHTFKGVPILSTFPIPLPRFFPHFFPLKIRYVIGYSHSWVELLLSVLRPMLMSTGAKFTPDQKMKIIFLFRRKFFDPAFIWHQATFKYNSRKLVCWNKRDYNSWQMTI